MKTLYMSIETISESWLSKMKSVVIGLVLVVAAGMALCGWAVNCFARRITEQITFTTYYPSPFGIYSNLEVSERFVVGNISSSGITGITSIGDLDVGEVWGGDSVVLEGHASDPAAASSKQGELIYNSTEKKIKSFNGSSWLTFFGGSGGGGGGGGDYWTECSWYNKVRNCWYCNGSCVPPSCIEGDTDLGVSCQRTHTAYLTNYGCVWGVCKRDCAR